MNSQQILDREFLEVRAKILQIAASLDRLDRAEGDVSSDARYRTIRQGVELLMSQQGDRAGQVQQLFSRQYDPHWRAEFEV